MFISALGTSTTASVTSASKSHQKIPQYGTLCANTATAASTSFLCVTSASEVQKVSQLPYGEMKCTFNLYQLSV